MTGALMTGTALTAQRPAGVDQQMSAHQMVQEMVRNEVKSQKGEPIYWRYREIDKGSGVTKAYEVDQTRGGTARALLTVNGQPLTAIEKSKEEARLQELLHDPHAAEKAARARHKDGEQERKLLEMLPRAFLFRYGQPDGALVRVNFTPNPKFKPPTRQAQVFHHMAGFILIDPGPIRLVEMSGRLTSEVKFFWGLLGHLNKGGTFDVREKDVGAGSWMMTRLRVNMQGVALFFKTIGVQEDEQFEDYQVNRPGTKLKQAVARLERRVDSRGAPRRGK